MRAIIAAVAGCLIALPAVGQEMPFRGQWQVVVQGNPNPIADVLIDADRRVIYDDPKFGKYRGYLASADASSLEIVMTNGKTVVHTRCEIESSDLLGCKHAANGRISNRFWIKRVKQDVGKLWTPPTQPALAAAPSLKGIWRLILDVDHAFSGTVTIDGASNAVLSSRWGAHDGIEAAAITAWGTARDNGQRVEIVFTRRDPPIDSFVDHLSCRRLAPDKMDCVTAYGTPDERGARLGMVREP